MDDLTNSVNQGDTSPSLLLASDTISELFQNPVQMDIAATLGLFDDPTSLQGCGLDTSNMLDPSSLLNPVSMVGQSSFFNEPIQTTAGDLLQQAMASVDAKGHELDSQILPISTSTNIMQDAVSMLEGEPKTINPASFPSDLLVSSASEMLAPPTSSVSEQSFVQPQALMSDNASTGSEQISENVTQPLCDADLTHNKLSVQDQATEVKLSVTQGVSGNNSFILGDSEPSTVTEDLVPPTVREQLLPGTLQQPPLSSAASTLAIKDPVTTSIISTTSSVNAESAIASTTSQSATTVTTTTLPLQPPTPEVSLPSSLPAPLPQPSSMLQPGMSVPSSVSLPSTSPTTTPTELKPSVTPPTSIALPTSTMLLSQPLQTPSQPSLTPLQTPSQPLSHAPLQPSNVPALPQPSPVQSQPSTTQTQAAISSSQPSNTPLQPLTTSSTTTATSSSSDTTPKGLNLPLLEFLRANFPSLRLDNPKDIFQVNTLLAHVLQQQQVLQQAQLQVSQAQQAAALRISSAAQGSKLVATSASLLAGQQSSASPSSLQLAKPVGLVSQPAKPALSTSSTTMSTTFTQGTVAKNRTPVFAQILPQSSSTGTLSLSTTTSSTKSASPIIVPKQPKRGFTSPLLLGKQKATTDKVVHTTLASIPSVLPNTPSPLHTSILMTKSASFRKELPRLSTRSATKLSLQTMPQAKTLVEPAENEFTEIDVGEPFQILDLPPHLKDHCYSRYNPEEGERIAKLKGLNLKISSSIPPARVSYAPQVPDSPTTLFKLLKVTPRKTSSRSNGGTTQRNNNKRTISRSRGLVVSVLHLYCTCMPLHFQILFVDGLLLLVEVGVVGGQGAQVLTQVDRHCPAQELGVRHL